MLRKLVKACEGKTFADRRDMALVRPLIDSGLRRGEAADSRSTTSISTTIR
jgi:hypothetical protein